MSDLISFKEVSPILDDLVYEQVVISEGEIDEVYSIDSERCYGTRKNTLRHSATPPDLGCAQRVYSPPRLYRPSEPSSWKSCSTRVNRQH